MAEEMADSETVTAHGGVRLAKDLFSGAMGGIAQVLLGQSLLHIMPKIMTELLL